MSQLKAEVLNYLQNDRTHAGAKELYLRHVSGGAFRSRVVSAPESELMRDMIRDELIRLAGINEQIAMRLWRQRIVQSEEASDSGTGAENSGGGAQGSSAPAKPNKGAKSSAAGKGKKGAKAAQADVTSTAKKSGGKNKPAQESSEKLPDEKTATLPAGGENSGAGATTPAEDTGKALPVTVQQAIKLREEFPFLAAADCPQELRKLVGAMLDAYDQYRHAHAQLFEAATPEELGALTASVAEGYLENRQIWEELNHYKQNGTVLGKHPSLVRLSLRERTKRMTVVELAKRKETIIKSISRRRGQIEKEAASKPHLVEGWKQALELDEFELELITQTLASKG